MHPPGASSRPPTTVAPQPSVQPSLPVPVTDPYANENNERQLDQEPRHAQMIVTMVCLIESLINQLITEIRANSLLRDNDSLELHDAISIDTLDKVIPVQILYYSVGKYDDGNRSV